MLSQCLIALLLSSSTAAAQAPTAAPVGRYESTGIGPVNVWWIETPDMGLVVFDMQRSAEQADAAIAAIRATGKPPRALLITHPHPDHVTGIPRFKAAFPGVPVYAQTATADEFARDIQKLLSLEGAPLPTAPDVIVKDRDQLTIGGLTIVARQLRGGESVGMKLYWLPQRRLLISGDVATPGYVPFMAEGRTAAWLGQLTTLSRLYPPQSRTLPGHGPEGLLGALAARQTSYLAAYRRALRPAVAPASDGGASVTPVERARVRAAVERAHPTRGGVAGMPLEQLHQLNADAVAKEIAR